MTTMIAAAMSLSTVGSIRLSYPRCRICRPGLQPGQQLGLLCVELRLGERSAIQELLELVDRVGDVDGAGGSRDRGGSPGRGIDRCGRRRLAGRGIDVRARG